MDFAAANPDARFHWKAQTWVSHKQDGIVDLLLLVDGREAPVIENKVGATVRRHDSLNSEPTPEAENQAAAVCGPANQLAHLIQRVEA
jgi:hypothetical protein